MTTGSGRLGLLVEGGIPPASVVGSIVPRNQGKHQTQPEDRVHGRQKAVEGLCGLKASGNVYRGHMLACDKEEMPIVWPKHADLCRTPAVCCRIP
jgi:hypothetical protein